MYLHINAMYFTWSNGNITLRDGDYQTNKQKDNIHAVRIRY